MVAIAIILAVIIAVFVFGLGDVVRDSPPNAAFEVDWLDGDQVQITHTTGDSIPASELYLVGPFDDESAIGFSDDVWGPNGNEYWNETVRAGDSRIYEFDADDADGTYRIVWRSNDVSTVLFEFTKTTG